MGTKKKAETVCSCKETTPLATFIDDTNSEAFLLQVCEDCGAAYLLMGQYPLVVC